MSSRAGAVIALMVAINPYLVWHSQDARMYSMSVALTLATTWLALRWLHTRRLGVLGAYIGISLWSLHVHYYAFFILLAQSSYVLVRWWTGHLPRQHMALWLKAQLSLALLYSPWVWMAREIFRGYAGTGESPAWVDMVWRSFSVFVVGEMAPPIERQMYAFVAVSLTALSLGYLFRSPSDGPWTATLLLMLLGIPLAGAWMAAWRRPLFNERYLAIAAPPFVLLVGALFAAWLPPRKITLSWKGTTLLVAFLSVVYLFGNGVALYRYFYHPAYDKIVGWRALAATLDRWTRPLPPASVRLAQNYPDPSLWYYYRGPVEHVVLPPRAHDVLAARATVADLAATGVVWVLLPLQPNPTWDDAGLADRALATYYTRVWEEQVAVWPVRLYARPAPDAWRPLHVSFANGLRLVAVQIQPAQPQMEAPLVIHTRWDIPPLAEPVKAFVHLVPAAGPPRPIAQCDPFLPAELGEHTVSCAFLVPPLSRPSSYRLMLGVYLPQRAGMPRVPTLSNGDTITVGEFHLP